MGKVNVKTNHLTFGSVNYFRAGADRVTLGAYGEKKSPVFQGNYLEVQYCLPDKKLDGKISKATIAEIDTARSNRGEVEADVQGLKVVNTGARITYGGFTGNKLKLVHLVIPAGPIKDAANDSPRALDRLRSYGADARIAHEIFVVMQASTAKAFTASASFDVEAYTGAGIVVAGRGAAGTGTITRVTLSAGTTYAYLLVKLKWKRGKTEIEKCTDDQWGPV